MLDVPHRGPPEFEPYWEALRENTLRLPRCGCCGRFHWYPMKLCPHCRSAEIEWPAIEPEGTVFTWTTVHYPFQPELSASIPYVVALIEVAGAPGPRLVSNLVDIDPGEVRIGMAVRGVFDTARDPPRLLFRPADAARPRPGR